MALLLLVCVGSGYLEFVNPLLVRIQSWFKSNPFEKKSVFQRSGKTTSCFIVSIDCFTLSIFKTGFEKA